MVPCPLAGGASSALRPDTLADSVLILLVLAGVQRAVGFVRAVLFCRWLEPDELGLWDMTWGFIVLAAPLVVLSLPGTFGRYVAHYEQRGQLRAFVRRTAACCGLLAGLAVLGIVAAPGWCAHLIFGDQAQGALMAVAAVCLLPVIVHNYLICLYTALRNVRLVAAVETLNVLLFAVLGVVLVLAYRPTARSVVLAYGGACLITGGLAWWWGRATWRRSSAVAEPAPWSDLWKKLAPFTAWTMLVNLLTNLFSLLDRYLIAHWAPGTSAEVWAMVGQYHSSRLLPLLLVSLAVTLSTVLLPHLSHDWERGQRKLVATRLRLFLKLFCLGITAGAILVLLVAPWLFRVPFGGKYSDGLAVLPGTLVYCIWFSVAIIAQQYLWCIERASRVCLATLLGLVASIVLNLLLLPRLGLPGVVLAAAAANLLLLLILIWFNARWGVHTDWGLWLLLFAPLALFLGPWIAILVLVVIVFGAAAVGRLFSADEHQRLREGLETYRRRFHEWLQKRRPPQHAGAEKGTAEGNQFPVSCPNHAPETEEFTR
jgi:O-antigen/teichoic acid export membrane protein